MSLLVVQLSGNPESNLGKRRKDCHRTADNVADPRHIALNSNPSDFQTVAGWGNVLEDALLRRMIVNNSKPRKG